MKRGLTKSERLAQESIRKQVVHRVLAGEAIPDLSRILGYPKPTIHRWLSLYKADGESALCSTRAIGAPEKLTEQQTKWIAAVIISKNPTELQFPFALWTREMVRDLIKRRFGVSLALTSVGNILHRLGLTVQRPLLRAYERNPVAVEHWLKVEYPKIRAQAKKAGGIIFFEDESGIRSDYHSGTTWAPRGKTPIVLRTGKRVSCNMLSAVSSRGELRFMVKNGGVGAGTFIQFLKRLIHGTTHPIFLVVDGHPAHRAKMTTRFVESLNGKIQIFFLPGYSPDLNPDELVWREIKNHDIGRQSLKDAGELTCKVYSALRHLQHDSKTVRSFFNAPTTRYAAK